MSTWVFHSEAMWILLGLPSRVHVRSFFDTPFKTMTDVTRLKANFILLFIFVLSIALMKQTRLVIVNGEAGPGVALT